jgi:hypothetical protein
VRNLIEDIEIAQRETMGEKNALFTDYTKAVDSLNRKILVSYSFKLSGKVEERYYYLKCHCTCCMGDKSTVG